MGACVLETRIALSMHPNGRDDHQPLFGVTAKRPATIRQSCAPPIWPRTPASMQPLLLLSVAVGPFGHDSRIPVQRTESSVRSVHACWRVRCVAIVVGAGTAATAAAAAAVLRRCRRRWRKSSGIRDCHVADVRNVLGVVVVVVHVVLAVVVCRRCSTAISTAQRMPVAMS